MMANLTFQELKNRARQSASEQKPNKVLIVFAFGKGIVLLDNLDDEIEEFVEGAGMAPYDLDDAFACIDYSSPGDGVWVASAKVIDAKDAVRPFLDDRAEAEAELAGWQMVRFHDFRPVTEKEWKTYREGAWPWP